jgi:uncharacterized membrane-anchored protein YitT (DUF2179 family)
MKKLSICKAILPFLIALLLSTSLHAQFLKKIMNSVKQTTQNRANDKADQVTNKALDKIDSGMQSKSAKENTSGSQGDIGATNGVLGAFAKAVQQNPNDTSAADVTIKALGLLTGGGGVSAADSAAAIKSFMTATGGGGILYQYLTVATSKQMGTTKDTTVKYLCNSGDGRSEMRINMPGAVSNKMISIGRAGQPKYSIMLYPESKTYSLNIIDTSLINSRQETYQVTKLGNETVQGYNCIHAKITSSTNTRFFKSSTTFDIWTSTEVPGYALIQKMIDVQNVQPKMMKALQEAGCSGYFVKMITTAKDYSMSMLLIKAEKRTFPASLFEIPGGYTESKQNMIYHVIPAAKK